MFKIIRLVFSLCFGVYGGTSIGRLLRGDYEIYWFIGLSLFCVWLGFTVGNLMGFYEHDKIMKS
jgi:hypothetical protein